MQQCTRLSESLQHVAKMRVSKQGKQMKRARARARGEDPLPSLIGFYASAELSVDSFWAKAPLNDYSRPADGFAKNDIFLGLQDLIVCCL